MIRWLTAFSLFICSPLWAAEAYKGEAGPFEVGIAENVIVSGTDRSVELRIGYPVGESGPYPVVILSHGGGCAGGSYSVVGDHWVSHGYVVIQPTHPDSVSTGFDLTAVDPRRMEGIIRQRVSDMSVILDNLQALETNVPALAGKIDSERLIAAGHSMGGATALLATGMILENPFSKRRVESGETRYDALLLLSEPGHNPTLPEEPWRAVSVPTFIYTGTNDYGSESRGNTNIPFEYAIVNEAAGPDVPKHHLWIDDVDHFIGGAWCKIEDAYDQKAVSVLRAVSTAFLDAYTKQDGVAVDFLNSGVLPSSAGARPALTMQ